MNRSGYALAELIVAVTLLAIGLLTAAGTAVLAMRWLGQARAEEIAVTHALAILDSVAASPAAAAGSQSVDGVEFRWSVASEATGRTVRISAHSPGLGTDSPLELELYVPRIR